MALGGDVIFPEEKKMRSFETRGPVYLEDNMEGYATEEEFLAWFRVLIWGAHFD